MFAVVKNDSVHIYVQFVLVHTYSNDSIVYTQRQVYQMAGRGHVSLWLFLVKLFSHSVVSDFLQLHELQHTRIPCPSPSPGVCSNSCLASR